MILIPEGVKWPVKTTGQAVPRPRAPLAGSRLCDCGRGCWAHSRHSFGPEVTGDDTLRSIVFDISRRNVWPAPFTGRCLRNVHADRWFGLEIELMRHLDEESAKYAAARA